MNAFKKLVGWRDPSAETPATRYHIYGIDRCPSCVSAKCLGSALHLNRRDIVCDCTTVDMQTFRQKLDHMKVGLGEDASRHRTAPFIWRERDGKKEFIGGYYQFRIVCEREHQFSSPECEKN